MIYERTELHIRNNQGEEEVAPRTGYVAPPKTISELDKFLGISPDTYHRYEDEFYSALKAAGIDSDEPNVLDPRKPSLVSPEKLDLDKSWSSLAYLTLMFDKKCEYSRKKIYCGSIRTTPPDSICKLLEIDKKDTIINARFSLGVNKGVKKQTARLEVKAGGGILNYYLFSVNDGEMSRRIIFQRTHGNVSGSVIADVNGHNNLITSEDREKYTEVEKNYKSVLKLIEKIEDWESSSMCETCPIHEDFIVNSINNSKSIE